MANNQENPARQLFTTEWDGGENGRSANSGRPNGASTCDLGSFVLNGRRFMVCPPVPEGGDDPATMTVGILLLEGRRCRIVEQPEHPPAAGERDPAEVLTARELQIATLVAHGQCTKRIAHQLCISEWTVQTHLRRIYAKLNVAGRAEMVFRCARRLGLTG